MKQIVFYLALFFSFSGPFASATELRTPEGPVILTVTGDIAVKNSADAARFDREMLDAIGRRSFTTTTIWTEGPQVFAGVPLADLAAFLEVPEGATLNVTAVNEYAISLPYEDILADAALLATERNGKPMSLRNKGPLWIVFPYDMDPRYQAETYHARSIWQVRTIDVEG